jgi:hypothetical protein
MKRNLGSTEKKGDFNFLGFEILSNDEMLKVRGGGKPKSRNEEEYELEG